MSDVRTNHGRALRSDDMTPLSQAEITRRAVVSQQRAEQQRSEENSLGRSGLVVKAILALWVVLLFALFVAALLKH